MGKLKPIPPFPAGCEIKVFAMSFFIPHKIRPCTPMEYTEWRKTENARIPRAILAETIALFRIFDRETTALVVYHVFWNYRYYRSNEFFSSDRFSVKYNQKKRKKEKRRERNFQLSRFGLRSELEYTNVASIVGNRVSSRKRFSNVYSPNAAWIRLTMRKTRPRVRCHFVITLTKHPHVNVAKYRGNGKRVSFHVE